MKNKITPIEKITVYVDMDGTLCDFSGAFRQDLAGNPKIGFPQSRYRFWAELKPIPGAIEGFNQLCEQKNFDVYFLTAPSTRNLTCYTEKAEWIQKYFGFDALKRLIISKNKSLMKGHYLIDDKKVNGAGEFEGELILIHSEDFPDWDSVLKHLGITPHPRF